MSVLDALLKLEPLERIPRSGWIQAGQKNPESVAAHSLGTAFLALALGPRIEPGLDVDRAVSLACVHDSTEALLMDLPRSASRLLPKGAKRAAEAAAAQELLAPLSELALERQREFVSGDTREARFAKLCDQLHMGVVWIAYLQSGWRNLIEFRSGIAALDTSEFAPCAQLQTEILDRGDSLLQSEGERA